jgi:hypothetical protein
MSYMVLMQYGQKRCILTSTAPALPFTGILVSTAALISMSPPCWQAAVTFNLLVQNSLKRITHLDNQRKLYSARSQIALF